MPLLSLFGACYQIYCDSLYKCSHATPTENIQISRSNSIDEYSVNAACGWVELMEGTDYLPRGRAFSEYATRQSHELNHLYTNSHHTMPHYQSPSSVSYMAANVQYSPVATTYSGYSPTYHSSSHHVQPMMYMGNAAGSSMGYHVRPPPRSATLPSQHKIVSPTSYYPPSSHNQHLQLRHALPSDFTILDTEEQSSENSETMRSEAVEPPLPGYPNVDDFEDLMKW